MAGFDRAEVLRYLGYHGQALDAELLARLEDVMRACEKAVKPRCIWRAFPLDRERGSDMCVWLEGVPQPLEGKDIAAHLQGAREAVLIACTLGSSYEREYQRRVAVSPTEALFFDAAASALVESAASDAEEQVTCYAAERACAVNRRYSPGYGDFPLTVQKGLLDALDAPRSIGLTATSEYLLVPTKSITAVMGVFDGAVSDAVRASCETCALEGRCAWRKQGRSCCGDDA